MGYIDTHAHIIPGIDDGPKTMEESKAMLHKAFEEGFHSIIATPHGYKGFSSYKKEDVLAFCNELEQYAKSHFSSDFSVYAGQEVFYNETALGMIQKDKVIPMANSNYILLEFASDVSFSYMLRGLREVAMSSYDIVLAHIERYTCLRDLHCVIELRDNGILTQMNYADIGGKWYHPTTVWCRKCLKLGLVDFLGTDMHDTDKRSSRLKPALHWLRKHLDAEYVHKLMSTNANDIFLHKQ